MFSLLHLTSLYVKLCFITSYNINVYSRDMYIGCIQSRRLVSCILRGNLCNSSCDWLSERWQGGGREVADTDSDEGLQTQTNTNTEKHKQSERWQTPTQMRDYCKPTQIPILHTLVNIVCSGRSSLWKRFVTVGRHRPLFASFMARFWNSSCSFYGM